MVKISSIYYVHSSIKLIDNDTIDIMQLTLIIVFQISKAFEIIEYLSIGIFTSTPCPKSCSV